MGHFIGTRLPYATVHNIAHKIWAKEGLIEVLAQDHDFLLFKFSSEKGLASFLDKGPWLFAGRHLVLKRRKSGMKLSKEAVNKISVWAHLHSIPIEYWIEAGLSYIASAVGVPLYADHATESRSRINNARVCVEVDASKSLLDDFRLDILIKESPSKLAGPVTIRVTCQWRPPMCTHCNIFGHTLEKCHRVQKVSNPTTLGITPAAPPPSNSTHQGNRWMVVGRKGRTSNPSSKGKDITILESTEPHEDSPSHISTIFSSP